MASPRNTYVNQLLTDVYVGYSNESSNLIAGQLFPTVYVDKETGLYFVRDKENLRSPADARRGEYSRANRVANNLSTASYTLEEKSLETPISERVMRNYADPFEPKKNATMLVTDKLKLDKEIDLQNTLIGGGLSGIDTASSWATITTDIRAQITAGRNSIQKSTGKKPNVCVISKLSLDALVKNTAFIASIQYVKQVTEVALREAIAAYFDVEKVLIADGVNNTSKEGQADVMDYIWSDNCLLAYVTPTPALETPTAGYEIKLKDAAYVDEWYEQEIKTTFVRANDFYDNKIVDPTAMYFIQNTI